MNASAADDAAAESAPKPKRPRRPRKKADSAASDSGAGDAAVTNPAKAELVLALPPFESPSETRSNEE